jgi:type II secretory pathway component PulK
MLFTLLTEPWVQKPESDNPYVVAWNFRGQPFEVDGVTWAVQDESGLMQVPLYGAQQFEQLLLSMDVAPDRARRLALQLRERQGDARTRVASAGDASLDGFFPIQSLTELATMPDMDAALHARLRKVLTLYPTPGFNPLTAPAELLAAQLTRSQSAGVLEARRDGRLDAGTLWKLAGIAPDDSTVVAPGPGFTVQLAIGLRESRLRRATTFSVRPYQSEPLAVWQRSKGEDPGAE